MSKRRQVRSPSPPAKLRRSHTPEAQGSSLVCSLPPTCHRHPAILADARELERHYKTYHTHVCQEKGCMAVFPDERLLELHFAECHDPIVAIRKERGEKTFACFIPTCIRMFETPAKRRMHLIDAHHYPKSYFFAVTNKGIGGLLEKWGEGVSLVRPEWKPRAGQVQEADKGGEEAVAGPSEPRSAVSGDMVPANGLGIRFPDQEGTIRDEPAPSARPTDSVGDSSQPLGWTFGTTKPSSAHFPPRQTHKPGRASQPLPAPPSKGTTATHTAGKTNGDDTAVDDLAEAMSSVSLVPRAIRFGRGGARAGFQRPPQSRKKHPTSDAAGESTMTIEPGL